MESGNTYTGGAKNSAQAPCSEGEEPLSMETVVPLDQLRLLECIKRKINFYKNWRTFALSSRDFHIYVTPDMVLQCYEEHLPTAVVPEGKNEVEWEHRRAILRSIAREMRIADIMPDHLYREGFHCSRFRTLYGEIEVLKYFLPLRAYAFGVSVRELERDKCPTMQKIRVLSLG